MKVWYKSKTLWINVAAAVLLTLEASTGLLQPFLTPNLYVMLAVGLPIINAVLRIVTTQGLTLQVPDAPADKP